jgi:GTP-binding nuclear protein Ran
MTFVFSIQSKAAILMFDVTARMTYKNIPNWHRDINRVWDNYQGPVVLVGNKVDIKERQVRPKDITYHRKKSLQYYDISVKSCYNFEKPFLHLIRSLFADPTIHFVELPALPPPEVPITVDAQEMAALEKQLAESAKITDLESDI